MRDACEIFPAVSGAESSAGEAPTLSEEAKAC